VPKNVEMPGWLPASEAPETEGGGGEGAAGGDELALPHAICPTRREHDSHRTDGRKRCYRYLPSTINLKISAKGEVAVMWESSYCQYIRKRSFALLRGIFL